ncbi:MAG: HD domain-containing protein [Bacteroidota bacterium]
MLFVQNKHNKLKIFNDPVYGFITIPYEIIFDLIEHPYFQRLRRIKQLGLTSFVYPGALHTRFHHAMGAMYIMGTAIEVLRTKGNEISDDEAKAVTIAILLHDIGHGPFSHALETSIVSDVNHEDISEILMAKLNSEFKGELSLAIDIFKNKYSKKFLHQLVSSQLDMDRLDYLKRDSFFTGVSEGVVSSDRIIAMLNVVNDELVIESKGIYSIEKFIIARRLMYWQVYLHKTVLAAENLLVNILARAKELALKGEVLFGSPSFLYFLNNKVSKSDFNNNPQIIELFTDLDDDDIMCSIKVWKKHSDPILSMLCSNLINRNLFSVELQNGAFDSKKIEDLKQKAIKKYNISENDVNYLIFSSSISNSAYKADTESIKIYFKDGTVKDIAQAADLLNISTLSVTVEKFFLCYPKDLR